MQNDIIRLGFIGGGVNSAVGMTHFIASQMDGLFRVEAGCFSRNEKFNLQTAERWGIKSERLYSDWEQLIRTEKESIDALVILTPTPEHTHPILSALRSGLPVICEKALTNSSAEALEIKRAVDETNGFLTVTYNYTGYPMVRELREMIKDGRFGRVEQIHIEMPQEGFARLDREGNPMIPQQWRLRDTGTPTISLDLGVHVHHLIDFLCEEKPLELVATQSSLGRFRNVVDNTMALVRYTNELESSIWFSKAALGHRNGLRVRVYGEKASAEWYQMEPETLLFNNNKGQQMRIDRADVNVGISHLTRYNRFKSGHPAGFLEAFANLYTDIGDCLNNKGGKHNPSYDYVFSAKHAWEGLVMLEAITTSAKEHRWVSINLDKGEEPVVSCSKDKVKPLEALI